MDIPSAEQPAERNKPARNFGLATLLLCVGSVLMGAGLKLCLIERCGNDIPYLDQWTAEGSSVLRPWLNGEFGWRHFFWPHGEHHPAVARIASLLCFVGNDCQWDDRVQLVANVGLFSAFLALLGFWALRLWGDWRWPVALLAVTALIGTPGIYENHLWGFQSAFFGVLPLGLLHLLGMTAERSWAKWALGALAGVAALFTIASGLASAVVLVAVAGIGLLRDRRDFRAWATLLINAGLVGWSLWLVSDALPASGGLAHGVGDLLGRLTVLMAWPLSRPAAVLLQVPLFACMALAAWNRGRNRAQFLVSVFGGWSLVLVGCLAVGRNSGFSAVAVRYWDILATGLVANVFALLVLWPRGLKLRLAWGAVALAWAFVVGTACWRIGTPGTLRWLGEHYAEVGREQRMMVTSYLQTGRFGGLGDGDTHPYLPHPSFTKVLLDDPQFRRVLPPSVVPACTVVPDEGRSSGFVRTEPQDGGRAVLATVGSATAERVLVSREIEACGRSFLRLSVRGAVGEGVADLYAEDAAGRRHDLLNKRVNSPGRFKTEHLAGGMQRFRIVARVKPGHELAFTEPVEIGRLSYGVPKFLAFWPAVFWCGVACFAGGAIAWCRRRCV